MENNLFKSDDPLSANGSIMLGTVVFNSGNLPNMIYRNEYQNLFVNVLAEGDNRGPGAEDGLQVKCNEFYNRRGLPGPDGWDIAVTKLGFTGVAEGIAQFQGACDNTDPSSPAGNRFYFNTCQTGDDASIYLNPDPLLSISNILYSHNSGLTTTPQLNCFPAPTSTPFVQLNPCSITFNEPQSCPSSFRTRPDLEVVELNPGCEFIGGVWICDKDLLDYYALIVNGLTQLIDGGDAAFLLGKISLGTPPGVLKNILLAASPYLSDTVLVAAIKAGLPPGILKDVLIANSPLSDPVLDALAGISLPNGIANQINAVQAGISAMTKLQGRIAYNKSRRELGVNELIRHYLDNDTLSVAINRVLTLLKSEGVNDPREGRQHEEAACNIAVENLTEAETVMNNLHLGTPDNACKLMQLQVDLKRANKQMKDMSKVQELEVRQIASEIEYKAQARAHSMLKAGFSENSREVIQLPAQNQLKIAPQQEAGKGNPLLEENDLTIFPNPFAGYTSVEAYVQDDIPHPELVIYNPLGIELKKYLLAPGYNIITILAEDLPGSGIYFSVLKGAGKVWQQKRMVLVQ